MSTQNNSITFVDDEFEMREASRAARMDLYDNNRQGIFTGIETVNTPRNQKLVTVSKKMERVSSKNNSDRFDELVCHSVGANDADGVFDIGVRGKVEDVVFPYNDDIKYYGPLTDVDSRDMKFFMSNEAVEIISDAGVDVPLFGEELDEIHSIKSTTEQEDLAKATYSYRDELSSTKRQMGICRGKITRRHPEWSTLSHREFLTKVSKYGEGEDCRQYLKLEARLVKGKQYIDTYSSSIMALSAPQVFMPDHIKLEDLKLPCYDIKTEKFIPEMLSMNDIVELANRNSEELSQSIDLEEIPELSIDL